MCSRSRFNGAASVHGVGWPVYVRCDSTDRRSRLSFIHLLWLPKRNKTHGTQVRHFATVRASRLHVCTNLNSLSLPVIMVERSRRAMRVWFCCISLSISVVLSVVFVTFFALNFFRFACTNKLKQYFE